MGSGPFRYSTNWVPSMKKSLLAALVTFLTITVVWAGYGARDILLNVRVNTTQLPGKLWVSYSAAFFGTNGCVWLDLSKINVAPRVSWKSAWSYIQDDLIPIFGSPLLTEQERQFCAGIIPAVTYVVKPNGTYTTRPLYDGELWLVTRDIGASWREIGRVEVGAACEPAIIRQTTFAYRWTVNANGRRGLSACVMRP